MIHSRDIEHHNINIIPTLCAKLKLKTVWTQANLMQTFNNDLLQNYSIEFLDIAHK